jgi:hypothetical protein
MKLLRVETVSFRVPAVTPETLRRETRKKSAPTSGSLRGGGEEDPEGVSGLREECCAGAVTR